MVIDKESGRGMFTLSGRGMFTLNSRDLRMWFSMISSKMIAFQQVMVKSRQVLGHGEYKCDTGMSVEDVSD